MATDRLATSVEADRPFIVALSALTRIAVYLMVFESLHDCWFLTGATCAGKTTTALSLAKKLDAEIIALDSMTLYRGMDLGTAKPTRDQQAAAPHHLIDVINPDEEYSLSAYLKAAHECVQQIRSRGKEPLFVGGTPLYLKSLLRGLDDGPPADWEFRQEVEQEVERVGVEALHERLRQVDPLTANKLPVGDVRRVVRALEVYKLTGQPISHAQLQFEEGRPAGECKVFVLSWERTELHRRIAERVDQMFANGFVDEVQALLDQYGQLGRTASQAVGYQEVINFLADTCGLEAAMENVKTRTRRFSKRQGTWFRGLSECRFIPCSPLETAEELCATILEHEVPTTT